MKECGRKIEILPAIRNDPLPLVSAHELALFESPPFHRPIHHTSNPRPTNNTGIYSFDRTVQTIIDWLNDLTDGLPTNERQKAYLLLRTTRQGTWIPDVP